MARIYFIKYKSSCWLVFFKIPVLQSFSKYFETLWCFIKFSVHHKWNDVQLLLIMISKYLLILKASSRRHQDMSWRRFQNVFSVTILRLPRHLKDILKTSWKTKKCYAEDVFMTSCRQTKFLLGKSLSSKSKPVSDKSISHISISDKSRWIQNAFVRT